MSAGVNPVQISVNDPDVTPIGAVGNGWMIGPATPGSPTWMWAEVPASSRSVGLVRPENVTALTRILLTSSRMKAAEPVPGDEFGGVSCDPVKVAVRGMKAAWAPVANVRSRTAVRSQYRQLIPCV